MKITTISLFIRATAFVFLLCTSFTIQAQIIYVKATAVGSVDGHSWVNAFTNLQFAIDIASPGDTVFVAAGTYLPDRVHLGDSLRNSTFYVNKTIHLFGGFSGEAGTEGGFSGRDLNAFHSILSGDLGIPDDRSDNAFHVLYLDHVSDTTWIDGFIIEKGDGHGGSGFESTGTGIFNDGDAGHSNPTIANCIIRDNRTSEGGGGMTNFAQNGGHASPTIIHCDFISNYASGGGGVSCYTDSEGETNPTIISCRFLGNSGATAGGGAIQFISHSSVSSPKIINCIITGNHNPSSSAISCLVTGTGVFNGQIINTTIAGNSGGSVRVADLGIQNSTLTLRNSIFWGNGGAQAPTSNGGTIDAAFCLIPFGFPGEGNIGLDPSFVSTPPLLDTVHLLGDVHLQESSIALDAGRNTDMPVSITKDLDGKPRLVNATTGQSGTVDMGPYEFQPNITSTSSFLPESAWNVYPSPATTELTISFSEITSGGQIQLMDLQARRIVSQKLRAGQKRCTFDVSDLPSGIYLLNVFHDGQFGTKKISIQ